MAKQKKMTENELSSMVNDEIAQAKSYDSQDLSKRRAEAIKYYQGDADIIPYEDGRSKVVSTDLSDHIGWILPSLMRVFASSDIIAEYSAKDAEQEQALSDAGATEYVNYKFLRDCEGYNILHSAFKDGFLHGNGVIKYWWDTSIECEFENYEGLDELQYTMLVADDSVEVVEHSERDTTTPEADPLNPLSGQITIVYDVRIKRKTPRSKLKIAGLPPEEFLINQDATSVKEADFLCHRYQATRASLIAQGYDRKKVMEAGPDEELLSEDERLERTDNGADDTDSKDATMVKLDVYECYILADYDGDDYPEWRRVVMAGVSGSKNNMLYNEAWDDGNCFIDLVPDPHPHRRIGISLFDELKPITDVKTVLKRQTLDNLYWANNPMMAVDLSAFENPEAIESPDFGGVASLKSGRTLQDAMQPIQLPFVADKSFHMLEYLDMEAEKRTGVSRQSMALDPEALSNQTAAGVQAGQSAAFAKTELYARNLAEGGLKDLFLGIYRVIKKNQDKPEQFKVNGEWRTVDPSTWPDNVEVSVNVGLGSGSKDRDMAMLANIKQSQEQILMQMGPVNPLVTLQEYSNTLQKMVETAGMKNPDDYFKQVTPEALQQMMAQQQDKPDPKIAEAQAKLQLEATKAQEQAALSKAKAEAEIQLMREKAAASIQMEREKHEMEMELRREEMLGEFQLTREANAMKAAQGQPMDTNLDRPV